jgi:hypothetical protein
MTAPSVITQTIDKTTYIPNFTNEVACFAGYFEKGPIDEPIFITDINQFKFIFGRGIDLHHNDWYQVYNYLQYANGIWVTRTSGNTNYNATNEELVFINNKEHFNERYEFLDTPRIKILAQTPGAWGNLLSVAMITYDQWINNEEIKEGFFAKNLFTFFEEGYIALCVFRSEKLVERFYKTDEDFYEINEESKYIYIKINGNNGNDDIITTRLDAENNTYELIDLNIELNLPFYRDLNINYESIIRTYKERIDCNDYIAFFDFNNNIELPFIADLNENSKDLKYKEYVTYYGENIIKLQNGRSKVPTDLDIENSYNIYEEEKYDIDIIIGNDKNNNAAVNLAEYRKDSIAFIGMPISFVEFLKIHTGSNNPDEIGYLPGGFAIAIQDIKIPFRFTDEHIEQVNEYIRLIPQSQYVHFTLNIKEQLDGFTGKYKTVNIAGDTAGLKAKASLDTPWSVGAGLEKGQIKNVNKIYLSVKDTDNYYKQGLNYIQNNKLMTQKTYYSKPSSFGRISTRSLFNHVQKEVEKLLRYYVFEENTYRVRGIIASTIKRYLEDVKVNQGIDAGRVEVRGQDKEIIVDVYIKPKYVTEYIQLRMSHTGGETISNILSNTIA